MVGAREQGKRDGDEVGEVEYPGHTELQITLKTLDFIQGKCKTLKVFQPREDVSRCMS